MSAATDATNDEAAVNNPTQQQQASKKSNKKRKRTKQSPDELYQLESTDKYNKLHHACWKHLHREAKVVKSFECQKIVRSIKATTASSDALNDSDDVAATGADTNANATSDDNSGEDAECATTKNNKKNAASKAQKRVQTLQEKLDKTKNMDLNVLVQVGLKRLGVLALDPRSDDENENTVSGSGSNKPKKWKKKSQQQQQQQQQYQQQQQTKSKDAETEMTSSSQSEDPFYQSLMETMLRHKRLSAALDQLNVKVADYRQWAIRRRGQLFNNGEDDFLMEDDGGGGAAAGKKKKKKNKGVANGNDTMVVAGGYNTRKRGLDLGGHEGESGLFIGSLSGSMAMVGGFGDDDDDDDDDEYGEEGDNEYGHQEQEEKKKNRPGQRARRAKAMAIEAKKAGRTWGTSTNWREKKERDPDAGYGDEYKQHHADSSRGHHVKSSRNHDDQQHNKSNNKQGRGRHEGSNEDGAPSTGKPKEAIASMGKAWKEEGNAHPSWAAAAAKKAEGIKEFQGTKITFD